MEENLDLRNVLATLRRWRRLIAGVFAAGVLTAVLFILLVTPKFTAEATLKFNPSQFEINIQKSNVGSDLFGRLIAGEIASIQSPAVLLSVLKSEQLLNDPELNRKTIQELAGGVITALLAGKPRPVDHELLVLDRFMKKLVVAHPERTNLITIAYQSESAEKSARVANAVVNTFLAQHLDSRLTSTPLVTKWLSERKESLQERWRQSENRVERFKAERKLSYVSGDKLREQHVDRLNEQLVLAEIKTEAARARVEQMRNILKSRDYQQLANVVRSAVLTRLRDRLAATSQREASLGSTLLPSHPQLQKVRAELASLRKHIDNEGRRLLDSLEMEFGTAQEREVLIRKNFDKTISNIQGSSAALVKLRELERTAVSDRVIFEAFLNRSNETMEQSTGNFANFHLIKMAQVPTRPSFPSKTKVLMLAMLGSLLGGVGLAFVMETHSNTFRTRAHVAEILKLPVIATLPHLNGSDLSKGQLRPALERVVANRPGSAFAQSISALKFGLDITGRDTPVRVLAVTSAAEQEGKTMVAASLAQHAALKGAKVLLIDCSWRAPRLHRIFETANEDGTGMNGGAKSPVVHDPISGLDILPAMEGAGSSAGFAGSKEFAELLESARNTYELVIIDTGAILSNLDSSILASEADATLLVVQWNKTRRDIVKQAVETLKNWNAHIFGVVLNDADLRQLAQEGEDISLGVVQKPSPARKRRFDKDWNNRGVRPAAVTPRPDFTPDHTTAA